jgi:hypothetical protein
MLPPKNVVSNLSSIVILINAEINLPLNSALFWSKKTIYGGKIMKKNFVLIAALVAALAVVCIGCPYPTNGGGESPSGGSSSTTPITPPVVTPPVVEPEEDAFFVLDALDGEWWYSNSCDDKVTSLDIETLMGAKFLVLKVISVAGQNGWGGIQLAVQYESDGWGWHNSPICGDWTQPKASDGEWDIAYASEDTFYLVVELSKLAGWNDFASSSSTKGKIKINSWPAQLKALPAVNGYLADFTLIKPGTGIDLAKDGTTYGWAQKDAPDGID